ncbi:MAG: glycosyltransferase [Cyanobacteria bacterium J06634_6]
MSVTTPFISVVIATRNRGDSVVHTVNSILKNDYPAFEIRVVDQSADDVCEQKMRRYAEDNRIFYQRTRSVGMAKARNMAIAQSKGTLIAITDDDCIVSDRWLSAIHATFIAHPEVTIVFGNVLPGDYDATSGFIPSYCRRHSKIVSDPLDKPDIDGIGACMAMRKSVWLTFAGFDEMLGAGSLLKSSSEGDLVIHALHQGQQVCENPDVFVVHNGFRTWVQGAELIGRYWYGTGAMYGKHLKLYPISTFITLALLAWRWAFGTSRVADSLGEDSQKGARLQAFVSGFFKGLWLRIDRKTGHFVTTYER